MRVSPLHLRIGAAVCVALIAVIGGRSSCESPPSGDDVRPWTAADHDHADESGRVASGAQASPRGPGGANDNRQLIELTWRQQCATCHGAIGHGDGPNGPMVKATNLTNDEWQKAMTDEQIAQSIQNGKGRMPKFDLPPAVVQGLVQRIRASRGR
jgi:cytochrome c oxidase cbb3-type subunit 3